MSAPCVIEIERLWTSFGPHVIHRDIDLCVQAGEVLALVGGSGAGKTTLLRIMLGLETPARGTVQVFGCPLAGCVDADLRRMRNRWGVLFQAGALFSALSVFDNVAFPLRELKCLPEEMIRDLVQLKLRRVGIEPSHAAKMPAELSGGMIKRAALARALALDPELLFLDEPTAGLDPDRAKGFVRLIESLRRELGLTVVMATHDVATLMALSDRVAVLADQRLIAVRPLWEIVDLDHPFIRNFFSGERHRCAQENIRDFRERLVRNALTV